MKSYRERLKREVGGRKRHHKPAIQGRKLKRDILIKLTSLLSGKACYVFCYSVHFCCLLFIYFIFCFLKNYFISDGPVAQISINVIVLCYLAAVEKC